MTTRVPPSFMALRLGPAAGRGQGRSRLPQTTLQGGELIHFGGARAHVAGVRRHGALVVVIGELGASLPADWRID